jgi:hydrogenase maturation factor HypF (carbamoyltransferase family)
VQNNSKEKDEKMINEDEDTEEYKRPLNTCEMCQEETRDRLEAARFFGARYLCCQRCIAAYEYKNEYRGDN